MIRSSTLFFSLILVLIGGVVPSVKASCTGPTGGSEGECGPDFSLQSLEGKTVPFSTLKGKVVFLNFWATWCEPCKVEIPSMTKAFEALKGKDFAMVAVSIDSAGAKVINKFFQNKKPPFTVLLDDKQEVSRRYGTFKVPETYIIDKTGRVRDKVIGIKEWSDPLLIHYLELLAEQ